MEQRRRPFYQKRAPSDLPPVFMRTVTLSFPSGRTAEEVVVRQRRRPAPGSSSLGCMELHPHPVLAADLDHPDELRVDLDPTPGVDWPSVREVSFVAREVPCRSSLASLHFLRPPAPAASISMSPFIRAGASLKSAAPCSCSGARSRAPRLLARHQQVVEGRAPRRLSRL